MVARLIAGAPSAADRRVLRVYLAGGFDVGAQLRTLAGIGDQLAAIARCQLVGRELDVAQVKCMQEFGDRLAAFDDLGSTDCEPRDDHPRSCLVATLEDHRIAPPRSSHLQVGLARPEVLYLIARRDGKPTLLRGAVLSFRSRAGAEVLDDAAWGAGCQALPAPAFTRSYRVAAKR
jgi:hypothetical protein